MLKFVTRRPLRHLKFAALIGLPFIATAPAAAQEFPWCSLSFSSGGERCSFVSFEQCMASLSGSPAVCRQNLRVPDSKPAPARRTPRPRS